MDPSKSEPLASSGTVDRGSNVLYYHVMMNGVGVLLSWNAICTGFDWINGQFSGTGINASFVFTTLNFFPNLIFQPLTVRYGHLVTFNFRIIIPYIAMGILLAITPIVVDFSALWVGFALMCVISLVIGAFNAVAQTSVFGLAATLPDRYTGAVMVGNGVAGVLICVLRVICLAAMPSDLLLSVIIYFAVSGVVLVVCMVSQWLLMHDSFAVECIKKTAAKVDVLVADHPEKMEMRTVDGASQGEDDHENRAPPSFMEVWRHIRFYAVLVFTCYFVTFGMYPTVCISSTGQ